MCGHNTDIFIFPDEKRGAKTPFSWVEKFPKIN